MAPFCSCPASLVSRIFFAVGPGCAKCFFFCCAPLGAATFRRGQSKKINTTQGVFFCSAFFALAPCRRPTGLLLPLPFAGTAAKKKKNTLGGVFFFALAPCRHGASPSPAFPRGRSKKKNTLGGVFFAAAPRGRSLTHCGPGWRCLPLAGVVFFFFAVAPPGRSLWAGAISARPGCFFLLLRPRRVFLDNNKKCLGYYIGSKKTRRGHSKKKTPLPEPHSRTFQTGWPGHSRCNAQRPYLRASKARRILHPTWRLTGSYK